MMTDGISISCGYYTWSHILADTMGLSFLSTFLTGNTHLPQEIKNARNLCSLPSTQVALSSVLVFKQLDVRESQQGGMEG